MVVKKVITARKADHDPYFTFDAEQADTFFGTTVWDGLSFQIRVRGVIGFVNVWRDHPHCRGSCGKWLSNNRLIDWKISDQLQLIDHPEVSSCDELLNLEIFHGGVFIINTVDGPRRLRYFFERFA